MLKILYPSMYITSLAYLDAGILKKKGIKSILMDLDNTIIRRDRESFEPEVEEKLKNLLESGLKLAVVSNNSSDRVERITSPLGIPTVPKAMKPARQAFRRGMDLLGTGTEETAVLGDQIFTDVLGGNRMGMFTILVTPMKGKEFWATRHFNRRMEKLVMIGINKKTNGQPGCFLFE